MYGSLSIPEHLLLSTSSHVPVCGLESSWHNTHDSARLVVSLVVTSTAGIAPGLYRVRMLRGHSTFRARARKIRRKPAPGHTLPGTTSK